MSKFVVRTGASTPAIDGAGAGFAGCRFALAAGSPIRSGILAGGFADLRSVDLFLIVIMSLFSGWCLARCTTCGLAVPWARCWAGDFWLADCLDVVDCAFGHDQERRIVFPNMAGNLAGCLRFVAVDRACGRIFGDGQNASCGYNHKTVVLYGDTDMLQAVRDRIERATWSGYDIVATVVQGDGIDLEELNTRLKPDEDLDQFELTDQNQLDEVMYSLRNSIANIRLLPDLMMYQILNHGMSVTVGIPMIDISVSPIFGNRQLVKAALDYTVATLALVLLSPLMLLIALAIKLTSPGPVLFKQKRHGWNDEEIWVYKFRSMMVHQESDGAVTQAQRHDPRVTALGRFLRRTSLDELPQFINVLQGSYVGGGAASARAPAQPAVQGADTQICLAPQGQAGHHRLGAGVWVSW
jgi:hypothetical protein